MERSKTKLRMVCDACRVSARLFFQDRSWRSLIKSDIANLGAEELSEEDQQLKNELDMLVERLSVCLHCF